MFDDKEKALADFARNLNRVSSRARKRLTVEEAKAKEPTARKRNKQRERPLKQVR